MEKKVAVVTGGAQGIGRAVVERLVAAGVHCEILDVNDASAAEVRQATAALGDEAGFTVVDVRDADAVRAVVQEISARTGGIDIAVTSAGVALHGSSLDVTPEQWARVFQVNVDGSFWCMREVARTMIERERPGSLVFIGSMSGDIANFPQGQSAYNASKGAIHVLTKCLAVEWVDHGIRVNAVAPGYVGTELTRRGVNPDWIEEWERRTPQKRMGLPQEIAELVEFLASDRASYMTGSVVTIDGGYSAL